MTALRRLLRTLPALALGLAGPALASAGTLCGTVRDAVTLAPIPAAGVFLRETTGGYTGLHDVTSGSGSFCISSIPPGTYDLEILVDDYRIAYLRDIAVTGTVTEVPVEVAGGALQFRRPYPSPAESQVTFSWFMPVPADARLAVFDARGRLVGDFAGRDLPAGMRSMTWDLRDQRGVRVPAGVYYARLESGSERRVRRFVCLP